MKFALPKFFARRNSMHFWPPAAVSTTTWSSMSAAVDTATSYAPSTDPKSPRRPQTPALLSGPRVALRTSPTTPLAAFSAETPSFWRWIAALASSRRCTAASRAPSAAVRAATSDLFPAGASCAASLASSDSRRVCSVDAPSSASRFAASCSPMPSSFASTAASSFAAAWGPSRTTSSSSLTSRAAASASDSFSPSGARSLAVLASSASRATCVSAAQASRTSSRPASASSAFRPMTVAFLDSWGSSSSICSRTNSSFSETTAASFLRAASAFRRATTRCFRRSPSSAVLRSASLDALAALSSALAAAACAFSNDATSATSPCRLFSMHSRFSRSSARRAPRSAWRCSTRPMFDDASWRMTWYRRFRLRRSESSATMKASASPFEAWSASRSFSVTFKRLSFSVRASHFSSTSFEAASMGSTYAFEPMMSSRYSNKPSSCGDGALGFIIAICSTSPWRMRKRLLSRSMPLRRRSAPTSLNVAVLPSTSYLLWFDAYAVRDTTSSLPGTSVNASGFAGSSASTTSAKCTETRADSRSGYVSDRWMSSDTLLRRSFFARLPKTKSIASITFDLPLPFGPTMDEKRLWNGPISRTPP
mmetsp:Transcript_30588/g.94739  ORF Transcript_30588/g.94739 Transcript_30588/m.94739 type:complete len:594 (-) Transcript_30588:205-1986(-)